MRKFAFFAPLAATMALAAATRAAPINQAAANAPTVTVTIGGDLVKEVPKLGQREVDQQVSDLVLTVEREMARSGALPGAQINLVLTDLKPNRPTFQQAVDRPGLSIIESRSIGGAAIEGEVVTAQSERLPVRYSYYSSNLADVVGYSTWEDADRAFDRLATKLSRGELVSR